MLLLIFELRFPSRLIFGSKKSHPNRAKTKPTVVPLKIQASHDITKQKSTPAGMLSFGAVEGLSAQIVLCLHSVLRVRTAFASRPGKTLHRTVLFPRLQVP